jgi:pyrroloquinoline-quinone synthase
MDPITEIDRRIEGRDLLTHPFYTRWTEGTLPIEAMREYAKQYYAFESSFPRYLSAIHSRTEDRGARQALLDNLWDEEHGEENHAELWLRFAEGIGVDRQDVLEATPNQGTRALLDTYAQASTHAPVAAGVAALYAYERQVPKVAQAKIHGLAQHYGIDDERTTRFFKVHSVLDEEHSEAEASIVQGETDHSEEAVATAQQALDAWWDFLDAVTPA